jgi:hypothetical protein
MHVTLQAQDVNRDAVLEHALDQMLLGAGAQFNQEVVEALVRIENRRGVIPLGRTA